MCCLQLFDNIAAQQLRWYDIHSFVRAHPSSRNVKFQHNYQNIEETAKPT